MAAKVLDSWALLAFFEGEPAAQEVEKLLLKAEAGGQKLLLCAVNWGEIYYSVMRRTDPETAEQVSREIAAMPIEIVPVASDLALVRQAARLKASRKLPYADAFAAALAMLHKAELITGDRDFAQVEHDVKVTWLQ